jgi:hypothetical protein
MNNIEAYRRARHLEVNEFLALANVDKHVLDDDFDIFGLSASKLSQICDVLGVQEYLILAKSKKDVRPLPTDYRTNQNASVRHTKYSLSAIYRSYEVSNFVRVLADHIDIPSTTKLWHSSASEIDKLSDAFGYEPGALTGERDPLRVFNVLRAGAEKSGLFVLMDDVWDGAFRGFCFLDKNQSYVFINRRKYNIRSRIFTIAHEVAHLALNHPGIVDPIGSRSAIEQRTNRVAAEYLLPSSIMERSVPKNGNNWEPRELVDHLAEKIPFSKYFIALRLQETLSGYNGFCSRWLSQVNIRNLPNKYGYEELNEFERALEEESTSDSEDGPIRRQGSGGRQVSRLGITTLSLIEIAKQQNLVSTFDLQSSIRLPAKDYQKTIEALSRKRREAARDASR